MSSTIRRVASDPGSFDIVLNTDILPESISGGAREFGTLWAAALAQAPQVATPTSRRLERQVAERFGFIAS